MIGGVTGLYLADVPTNTIFHGDMFTVAHFHFTLVGGAVFGFLAGFYYWFPKMTGRKLDQGLAKLHFWLFEIGFLGVFIPLFYAGLKGEPRWQAFVDPTFGTQNLISSLFVILIIASVAVLGYNMLMSWIRGERAEVNAWGGRTLEWLLPSPVPLINFERPVVVSSGPYDYGTGGPADGRPRDRRGRGRGRCARASPAHRTGRAGRHDSLGGAAGRSSPGRRWRRHCTSGSSTWTR